MDIVEKSRTLLEEHQIVVKIVLAAEPMFSEDSLHCGDLRHARSDLENQPVILFPLAVLDQSPAQDFQGKPVFMTQM